MTITAWLLACRPHRIRYFHSHFSPLSRLKLHFISSLFMSFYAGWDSSNGCPSCSFVACYTSPCRQPRAFLSIGRTCTIRRTLSSRAPFCLLALVLTHKLSQSQKNENIDRRHCKNLIFTAILTLSFFTSSFSLSFFFTFSPFILTLLLSFPHFFHIVYRLGQGLMDGETEVLTHNLLKPAAMVEHDSFNLHSVISATQHGHVEQVETALKQGLSPNATDDVSWFFTLCRDFFRQHVWTRQSMISDSSKERKSALFLMTVAVVTS